MKMTKLLRIRGQHHFVELYSEALILTQCKPMHHYGERKKKIPRRFRCLRLVFLRLSVSVHNYLLSNPVFQVTRYDTNIRICTKTVHWDRTQK